ncbi:MAG: selenocysteine-specific translation elongation factor [Planctomycetes bacterium]|nr:selenocysteine-specific translation elongation factor [Planctomycetota bacterium]
MMTGSSIRCLRHLVPTLEDLPDSSWPGERQVRRRPAATMKNNLESICNIVLGTAGHIDHGKSSLVKRLTGIDPDRLPEEKERGLTIDLGFASFLLPDGRRVGIVDVPGHERLIKNMVAGATGIDLVLLVVAADDGVMPQTREHLTIMEVLGLEHGVVAITKIDLVDDDLRQLVREEIREALAPTFLRAAPIAEVSSLSGEGFDELRRTLVGAIGRVRPRETGGLFRMPVQRVFSLKGFGTVLTGIPVSGSVGIGDVLEVVPLGQKGRVRGIQAYQETTDIARAGHSTAINLTDVDYRAVHRGMVLGEPGYFAASKMYEARLSYLPRRRRPLLHQSSIRLHVGTAEALGRVFLLEKKALEPGEESFVQLRLEEPVAAAPGDRFVLRLHSPMETIGGGEILSASRWRLKTGKEHILSSLRAKEEALGDAVKRILGIIEDAGYETVAERDLPVQAGRPPGEVREHLERLLEDGHVIRSQRAGQVVSARRLADAARAAGGIAARFFEEQPRRLFMETAHLRQSLHCGELFLQELLARLEAEGIVAAVDKGRVRWRDLGPRIDEEDELRCAQIIDRLRGSFTPPSPAEMAEASGWPPEPTAELFDLLAERGDLQKIAESIYFHAETIAESRRRLREHLEREGSMTAADARNLLETTRKYIIPLLEQLDREGLTYRKGDLRMLRT